MANYQHIRFRIDDRAARITFARPLVNIFNIAMMREINERRRSLCSGLISGFTGEHRL